MPQQAPGLRNAKKTGALQAAPARIAASGIAKAQERRRITYRHPQYTREAVAAQRAWDTVSGLSRTHYAGAYWRYGFHEDGVWSALRTAEALGVTW